MIAVISACERLYLELGVKIGWKTRWLVFSWPTFDIVSKRVWRAWHGRSHGFQCKLLLLFEPTDRPTSWDRHMYTYSWLAKYTPPPPPFVLFSCECDYLDGNSWWIMMMMILMMRARRCPKNVVVRSRIMMIFLMSRRPPRHTHIHTYIISNVVIIISVSIVSWISGVLLTLKHSRRSVGHMVTF